MNLAKSYEQLTNLYETHLEEFGVRLPRFNSRMGCVLTILYSRLGEYIHIDEIKTLVEAAGHVLTGSDPLQVRHLSTQMGWWIERQGRYHHMLISATEVLPGFLPARRAMRLTEEEWTRLKQEYGNACVNCGSINGEPLRWNPTRITVLQQGHMDPQRELTLDNCIPQCQFCNQQYRNRAVFNRRGFVIAFNPAGH